MHVCFFFNDTATTEIYTLSLHDALPISGAEVSAFPARCPHRLVPLSAATVVDGRLTCPHHGWQYDGEGRCVSLPSLGPDGTAPPRADLPVPWAVEERHGWVWLAPERTAVPASDRKSTRLNSSHANIS